MLVNCGKLGLDPAGLSLSGYLEALAAHNAASDPGSAAPADPVDLDRLSRFHRARKSITQQERKQGDAER